MKNRESGVRVALYLCALLYLAAGAPPAHADEPIQAVIADFDYDDTSGEVRDQTAEHAAMMRTFVATLRHGLEKDAGYTVRHLPCDQTNCTAGNMDARALIESARQDGGRLLVFGGIHKMSTLVQWGKVYMVDVANDTLLLERSFSFRGDDEPAFRRAAEFVAGVLARTKLEPSARPARTSRN